MLDWLAADLPTSSCTPATSCSRIPTTTPTGPSPRRCSTRSPVPYVVIPGNHDIGFFGEEADLPRRLAAFRAAWGDDRFVRDLAGWRLVGADAYLLGTATTTTGCARR